MNEHNHVHLPVLLGTVRQDRKSERVALWLVGKIDSMEDVSSELIDLRQIAMSLDDAGRGVADPNFASMVDTADGLVLVIPEYNGGYPGLLKHALDTLRDEYVHKAVGIAPVSAGGLGGVRMVPTLLPVLRDLGLVAIKRDLSISHVGDAFTETGSIEDARLERRAEGFLDELVWMTRVLLAGRTKGES